MWFDGIHGVLILKLILYRGSQAIGAFLTYFGVLKLDSKNNFWKFIYQFFTGHPVFGGVYFDNVNDIF